MRLGASYALRYEWRDLHLLMERNSSHFRKVLNKKMAELNNSILGYLNSAEEDNRLAVCLSWSFINTTQMSEQGCTVESTDWGQVLESKDKPCTVDCKHKFKQAREATPWIPPTWIRSWNETQIMECKYSWNETLYLTLESRRVASTACQLLFRLLEPHFDLAKPACHNLPLFLPVIASYMFLSSAQNQNRNELFYD